MEAVSIKDAPVDFKLALLRELGLELDADGVHIKGPDGKWIVDEYVDQPVRFDNMILLPGSVVVLDENPVTIHSYMEDHPDVL
jgi:hypothetical protein